jgi:hypothetical protein
MPFPTLKPQEIPFDDPRSDCFFQQDENKPFVATPAAHAAYGEVLGPCLAVLQRLAREHNGVDYLQVFTDSSKPEALWFIEDGDGGAITALLPSDY